MNDTRCHAVRFGSFELDLRTGELRKAGIRIGLPEQPFQVLRALVERPGDLVTREELRQRLWPADTFVDFEQGLNAAVRRLREALGDSAETPRFVETLPRRGYRFVAPVAAIPLESSSVAASAAGPSSPARPEANAQPDAGASDRPSRRPRSGWSWGLIGLASVAALLTAAFVTLSPGSPTEEAITLAVLPLENHTGDPGRGYVGDGLADVLSTAVGTIDPARLVVVGRASPQQLGTAAVARLTRERRVSYVVGGSVFSVNPFRVDVWLTDTGTGRQLWARMYERTELVVLHRDMASNIAQELAASLGVARATARSDDERYSTSEAALDHYMRGREQLRANTRESLEKAKAEFQKATELDESFALGYSGMADVYMYLGSDGFMPMRHAYSMARGHAQKALGLNDGLAEAHASLASVMADHDWDWRGAERHFRRAIDLDPGYSMAYGSYAFFLACMRRPEDAAEIALEGLRREQSTAWALMNLGIVHYLAGRYPEAASAYDEVLTMNRDHGPAHTMMGRVHSARGRHDEAIAALDRARKLLGERADVLAPYAYVLARAGRVHDARKGLDELFAVNPPPFSVAYVYVGLGQMDEAFEWLNRAADAKAWQLAMLNVEPAFDGMRSDERFIKLLDRVGLPR